MAPRFPRKESIPRALGQISKSIWDPKVGGNDGLQKMLGLRGNDGSTNDVVFVSFDMEVANRRKFLSERGRKPIITHIAFANLDVRDFNSLPKDTGLNNVIRLNPFEVMNTPRSGRQRARGSSPRIFQPTELIPREDIATTITRHLQIPDTSSEEALEKKRLRNIVLVGQSIRDDIKFMHQFGANPFEIAPITMLLDTHELARWLLPPYNPNKRPKDGQDFSLAGILGQLGWSIDPREFHDAGNDTVYALYAMLLLAVKGRHRVPPTKSHDPTGKSRMEELARWLRTSKQQLDATSAGVSTTEEVSSYPTRARPGQIGYYADTPVPHESIMQEHSSSMPKCTT